MCTTCLDNDIHPNLIRRFREFHDHKYVCATCDITDNDQCLPRAIAQGQHPSRVVLGCIDSRATPDVVFRLEAAEAFTDTSMAGLMAPYGSHVARLSWEAELTTAISSGKIREIVFLGHTSCAGGKNLCNPDSSDAALHTWQVFYKPLILPLAEKLYGHANTPAEMSYNVERAITVYMVRNLREFIADRFADKDIAVKGFMYHMREGNLSELADANKGTFVQLTDFAERDLTHLPHVCPKTGVAFADEIAAAQSAQQSQKMSRAA